MVNVIGVRFQNAGKLYFFDPGAFWPTPGDFVIVETARGIEFGEVVTGVRELNDEQLAAPLKKVVRIATAQDVQHAKDNERNEKEAYGICQRKIAEHKLDMKLVSVEYTFDNSKILFYFTANGRVDFRSLVKDLAAVFKTRIELRQIGVRDEAKMLGGLGPCGRPICCGAFLGDFQPVSIKMAKEQNLSLNPTKISGVCGRLMCCLKYEEDNYEQTRKRMPKVGKEVITPDGVGVVWDLNVIKETVRVRLQKGDSSEVKDFPLEDVQRPGVQVDAPKPAVQPAAAAVPPDKAAAQTEDAVARTDETAFAPTEAQPQETSSSNDTHAPVAAKPAADSAPAASEAAARNVQRHREQSARRREDGRGENRQPRERRPQQNRGEPPEREPREGKGTPRLARPVMRQNTNKRPAGETPIVQPAAQPSTQTAVPVAKPAVQPTVQRKSEGQRQDRPPRNDRNRPEQREQNGAAGQNRGQQGQKRGGAQSPWKQAVERAMKAAQGDESAERIEKVQKTAVPVAGDAHQPISLEDHQDTYVFRNDGDEDDTI